ncbi:hypothetical protein H8356DRAFT_1353740 [Neocallimastix lanati (nom. inval.)]|nr:hypothetical protein H8356DRAFT_1353740 [Neocallimastix sp. JGI-2020a]
MGYGVGALNSPYAKKLHIEAPYVFLKGKAEPTIEELDTVILPDKAYAMGFLKGRNREDLILMEDDPETFVTAQGNNCLDFDIFYILKQNNVFIILLTTELCYSAGHDPTSLYQPDIKNVKKIFQDLEIQNLKF